VRPALLVLLYALAVAWFLPVVLTRMTAAGISARLGLAASIGPGHPPRRSTRCARPLRRLSFLSNSSYADY
jgi:hypothetical protein